MFGLRPLLIAAACSIAVLPLIGQTRPTPTPPPQEVELTISRPTARKLALAIPELATPGTSAMRSQVSEPFTATLRSDAEYSGAFVVADPVNYPTGAREPSVVEVADRWRGTGAEMLVDARATISGDRVVVEARVWDLASRKVVLGRRYTGGATYVERIAHTLANDLVKHFTGKNGLFLSTVVFVSDREGNKEIFAMDFDGRGPRRLTGHRSLTISPDGGPTGKIAYTTYARLFPQIWTMKPDGSEKREVPTGLGLNASQVRLVVVGGDGTLVVPVDFVIRRPAPGGPGRPGRAQLTWLQVMRDRTWTVLPRRGRRRPAPLVVADRWGGDSAWMAHGQTPLHGTWLVEGKRRDVFSRAAGRRVPGADLRPRSDWPGRESPPAPGGRYARLTATSATSGRVTLVLVDKAGEARVSVLCRETTLSAPRLIRAWGRRRWMEPTFRTLKHLLAAEACQVQTEAAYDGHLVGRLLAGLVLCYTARFCVQGQVTLEAIVFSLKPHGRVLSAEPRA